VTLAVLLGSLASAVSSSEYEKPVSMKGSYPDTSLTLELTSDKRKFRAIIKIGVDESNHCIGTIGLEGEIESEECEFPRIFNGFASITGEYPVFIFNEERNCLGEDALPDACTQFDGTVYFDYPTKSAKLSLPSDSKSVEELQKRILELEKRIETSQQNSAKTPAPQKRQTSVHESTGSGFFVSKKGHILTNEHVVRDCGSVTVGDNANNQVTASIKETDERNDLALLRISSTKMTSAETKSLIRKLSSKKLGLKLVPLASEGLVRVDDVELGEDILVAGYPYGELFSDTIKVTKGIVSANKGMGDDRGQFQMDAAVQSGNSGGPVYDENGNIVGVVIAQLDKRKVEKTIGSLPENVNFGIKASTVRQFLTSAGLPTKWSNRTERKSTKELAQIAKNQTVMVVCNP